jgi:hypothetical protein
MLLRILAGGVVAVVVAAVGLSYGLPDAPTVSESACSVSELPPAEHSCCHSAKAMLAETCHVEEAAASTTCPVAVVKVDPEALAAFTGTMTVSVVPSKKSHACCEE